MCQFNNARFGFDFIILYPIIKIQKYFMKLVEQKQLAT